VVLSLRRIVAAEDLRALAHNQDIEITGVAVRSIIDSRRLRDDMLGPGIGDAGWALLLEVFAARLEGRRPGITRLIEMAELAPATADRWIEALTKRGFLVRRADPAREHAVLVDLTEEAADRLRAYLKAALNLSPWLP
jgi:predicted transcriptional regulator